MYQLIEQEKAHFPIVFMARVLGIGRAGYYAWRKRRDTPGPGARRRERLTTKIQELFDASDGTSGARRLQAELDDAGERASLWLIRSIMHELGIAGVQPRTKKRTTIPAEDADVRPDLIGRVFAPDHWAPGQACVGDITYLRSGEGWLYLATVIDLATRQVVGWAMADHMRAQLVCDALDMAHTHGHIDKNTIFHSDRGAQYTSDEFARTAARMGVRLSVGRTGSVLDNAVAESWFSMLKNEMYHRYRFTSRAQARFAVMQYIEIFYNRKRRHSVLNYQTPATVLAAYQNQSKNQIADAA